MKKPNFVRTFILAGSLLLQLGPLCFQSRGAAGDVDLSFDPGSGVNGRVNAVVLQPDGKVLIGGEFTMVRGLARTNIARLNADGSGDSSFGVGTPSYSVGQSVRAVALQPDGKVLVGDDYFGITRLNSDGSLDTSFNANILPVSYTVGSIAVQPDGKVVIGGSFTSVNGTIRNGIARLNANGSLDTSFNPGMGPNESVRSLALQADGKLLIGGRFSRVDGTDRNGIARLNANGSLDGSFDPSTLTVWDLDVVETVLQPDGKVLVATYSLGLIRLNTNGSLDNSFYCPVIVYSIALRSDGRILIGGNFTQVHGTFQNRIARLNANGSLDTSFNPGTGADAAVFAIALQSDGKVLIGGTFIAVNGTNRNRMARLNADGSLDGSFNPGTGINAGVNSVVVQPDGQVLIAGGFTTIKDFNRHVTARLHANGSGDGAFSQSVVFQDVSSLALQSDGKAIIIGEGNLNFKRLNIDGSLDNSFVPDIGSATDIYDYSVPSVIALQSDGKVLVGGTTWICNFDVDLQECAYTAVYFLNRLNPNGSRDSFNPPSTHAYAILQQPDGKLLISGYIDVGGTNYRVARLNSNGSLDSSFNAGVAVPSGLVSSMALQPDGKILIGGDFLITADGAVYTHIARLNAGGSFDNTFNAGTNFSTIYSLVLQPDGKVIIGVVIAVSGTFISGIARLNADGSLDSSFNLVTLNGGARSMALQQDGCVLIGGDFTTVNGALRPHVARLYGDSPWPSLNIAQVNASVLLSWPTNTLNFQLQENTNVSLPNAWSLVAQARVTNGAQIFVTVPVSAPRKFFRLKSQ